MQKKVIITRILMGVLLSFIALYFEKATGARAIYLELLLMGTLLVSIMGIVKRAPFFYYIECGLVFGLNYFTRFNLNLVFVSFYLWMILYSFFSLQRQQALKIGLLCMVFLSLNFYILLPYGYNYELITQMVFLELMLALVMTTLYYLKSYQDEKNKVVGLLAENEAKRHSLVEALETVSNQNISLEEAQAEVIRLTRIAERANVASALHDTVGHELTGLIMQIEMLNMQYQDPIAKEAANHAREILRITRQTVETLQSDTSDASTMMKLKQKVDAFSKQANIKINFNFDLNIDIFMDDYRQMIYRTVLESLTNIVKHSSANEVWLILNEFSSGEFLLKIMDNGKTSNQSSDVVEGNGLKYIRERVARLGGRVEFLQNPNTGFQTIIKFSGGVYV